jgi:hypothetical protein
MLIVENCAFLFHANRRCICYVLDFGLFLFFAFIVGVFIALNFVQSEVVFIHGGNADRAYHPAMVFHFRIN